MARDRIQIGVSSCLLGEPVRYDGSAKYTPLVAEYLAQRFELLPFCPEVAIGMGVPRAPIQLVQRGDEVHALGVEDPGNDFTVQLESYARAMLSQLEGVCGYIFKARSPSCGFNSTPLFNEAGRVINTGSGLFAAVISRSCPGLPLAEETALGGIEQAEAFAQRVRSYHHRCACG